MSTEVLYVDKELSWLSFNERVLQEAADKTVPLIERIRFLGIYSNNLDEFYKVRFADVKRRILINQDRGHDDSPKKLLVKMQEKAKQLGIQFEEIYHELIRDMARRRIFLINEQQISDSQQKWVRKYFQREILPHIAPIFLNDDVDVLQFLKDEYAYLAVKLSEKGKHQYSLVEIPTDHLPRFVILPDQKGQRRKTIILLDNIIRFCLDDLYKGFFDYQSIECFAVKMTRDAEYDLSHEVEHSLLEQMSEGLEQRLTAMPVRFVYQEGMPKSMVELSL